MAPAQQPAASRNFFSEIQKGQALTRRIACHLPTPAAPSFDWPFFGQRTNPACRSRIFFAGKDSRLCHDSFEMHMCDFGGQWQRFRSCQAIIRLFARRLDFDNFLQPILTPSSSPCSMESEDSPAAGPRSPWMSIRRMSECLLPRRASCRTTAA